MHMYTHTQMYQHISYYYSYQLVSFVLFLSALPGNCMEKLHKKEGETKYIYFCNIKWTCIGGDDDLIWFNFYLGIRL